MTFSCISWLFVWRNTNSVTLLIWTQTLDPSSERSHSRFTRRSQGSNSRANTCCRKQTHKHTHIRSVSQPTLPAYDMWNHGKSRPLQLYPTSSLNLLIRQVTNTKTNNYSVIVYTLRRSASLQIKCLDGKMTFLL